MKTDATENQSRATTPALAADASQNTNMNTTTTRTTNRYNLADELRAEVREGKTTHAQAEQAAREAGVTGGEYGPELLLPYAGAQLKVGDRVGCRVHTDIDPGTVVKASATRATVQLHSYKLLNGPNSGAPDAMTFSPGGFCGHTSGTPRYEIDFDSNNGTVEISFRKGAQLNGQRGVWYRSGYAGGRAQLGGVVYVGAVVNYDYNF